MSKVSCEDCAHAAWQRTPSGRIKKNVSGKCNAPLPDIKPLLPSCADVPRVSKRGIWTIDQHNCPLWTKEQK